MTYKHYRASNKMMLTFAVAMMAATVTHAGSRPTLHKSFQGEWCVSNASEGSMTYRRARCRGSDGWLNVRATGFSAHEMDCTLRSASPNRSGEYRAAFACRGTGETWAAYYWIGIDTRNYPGHLFLNETNATFTGMGGDDQ